MLFMLIPTKATKHNNQNRNSEVSPRALPKYYTNQLYVGARLKFTDIASSIFCSLTLILTLTVTLILTVTVTVTLTLNPNSNSNP